MRREASKETWGREHQKWRKVELNKEHKMENSLKGNVMTKHDRKAEDKEQRERELGKSAKRMLKRDRTKEKYKSERLWGGEEMSKLG